jgi:hypothetical protein
MSKHTPGPWHAVEGTVFKDYGDKAYPVASVESWGEDTDHNARLIAAAPMMYEALKAAEPYLRHANVAYNVYVQARAAISKAEGA